MSYGTGQSAGGGGGGNVNLAQVGGVNVTLGQKLMAASIPVVLASDESALAVSQSGAWTVAATQSGAWNVGQSGAPWSQNLTQIGGAAYTLGQKTMANSAPVTIASDQSAIAVTGSFSASTAADVLAGDATYSAGQTGKNLTQTPTGRLRVAGMLTDQFNNPIDQAERNDYLSGMLIELRAIRLGTQQLLELLDPGSGPVTPNIVPMNSILAPVMNYVADADLYTLAVDSLADVDD